MRESESLGGNGSLSKNQGTNGSLSELALLCSAGVGPSTSGPSLRLSSNGPYINEEVVKASVVQVLKEFFHVEFQGFMGNLLMLG